MNILKKILQKVRRASRRAIAVGLGIGLIGMASAASAQVSIPLKTYPLTNSAAIQTNSISITNGYTSLSSNCTYIVQSQPFQIWRGRGFSFNTTFSAATAVASTETFNFRFASVHTIPGTSTYVTNWTTDVLAIGKAANGTTAVVFSTNVTANVVDNYTLGQLYSIGTSAGPNIISLDPTNTFIGVYP